MASRRSHAASHSRTTTSQRSVPRGHVSIRNPLQAPKERSCGISITSSSLVPQSGPTIILNIIRDASVPLRGTHSSYSISLLSSGAWLRRDAIASYDYPFLLCNLNDGSFVSCSAIAAFLHNHSAIPTEQY